MALKWIEQKTIAEFVPESPVTFIYPQTYGLPLEVRVRFVSHAFNPPRPVLCIEIEDGTTQKNIMRSWDELKRIRSELNKTRGPYDRPGGGAATFYGNCWRRHEEGYTWGDIAAWVNVAIKKALMPRDPFTVPSTSAATLIEWACGDSRGQEEIPADLQPADVTDLYPATAAGLKARVRSWRERYGTG